MDTNTSKDTVSAQIGDNVVGAAVGKNITQTIHYHNVKPQPVTREIVNTATTKVTELPLDQIPAVATLPAGSHMELRPNSLFVGRKEELRSLAALLKGGQTAAVGQTAAATGMGGIGKTQLAAAFVHRYGQFFQGGVFWLSMADQAAIPTEIVHCGMQMSGLRSDYSSLDFDTQMGLVLAAWQNEMPRLLIFDNCEESSLLAQWRPPTGGCRVLVTSRRSSWDLGLGVKVLPLDILTSAQSLDLLKKYPEQATPPIPHFTKEEGAVLGQIAVELGNLPLALHLAGSFLARYRHSVTPDAYLNQLRSPDLLNHPSLHLEGYNPTGHEQHVARTFAISYEQLDSAKPLDTQAIDLLMRAAYFSPGEPIPRNLLLSTLSEETDDADVALQLEDALRRLADLGLAELEAIGTVRLHRLIATFVLNTTKEEKEKAQEAVESAVLAEADGLNNAGIPGPLLAWEIHLRHITDVAAATNAEQAAGLCNTMGFHLQMIGAYEAARPYLQQALDISKDVLGEQHPDTAGSLNNMGALLQAMGELEAARPYFQQALDIFENRLGSSHPYTETVRKSLAALES